MFGRGDILRKWREQKNWAGEHLAAKAGVDKNTVTRAEGDGAIRDITLERLVLALGHSMAELYGRVAWHRVEPSPDLTRLVDVVTRLRAGVAADLIHDFVELASPLLEGESEDESPDARPDERSRGKTRVAGTTRRASRRR